MQPSLPINPVRGVNEITSRQVELSVLNKKLYSAVVTLFLTPPECLLQSFPEHIVNSLRNRTHFDQEDTIYSIVK